MDYKRIIKSRDLRQKLLRMLWWIPDSVMLKIQYRIKFGRKLDLKNPQRFSEKIQWYKLNYKNPIMIQCVDKYDVRSYIEKKGLKHYLTDCYGIYDDISQINFDLLPNKFVLKDTLASGGNSIKIIKNKNEIDFIELKKELSCWLALPIEKDGGREWPYYSGKQHRIIIEELLEENPLFGITDYKFFCFNGTPYIVQMIDKRKIGTGKMREGYFDTNWNLLHIVGEGHDIMKTEDVIQPHNYSRMLEMARIISEDFPFARIDLYNISGRIIFGEITFYPASGYNKYSIDSFDYDLGNVFLLPNNN